MAWDSRTAPKAKKTAAANNENDIEKETKV